MEFRERIRRSALWAAYGDALGFITELAGTSLVKRRTGMARVEELQPWTRRIGGRFGIDHRLPFGCYSDDTQLRLATARAIRGNGEFDVETFANVELPVWNAYALGAGLATKAAAENLAHPGVRWCSNVYNSKSAKYINSGGNGAAMRIQPHVWCLSVEADDIELLREVVRNCVVTHGHTRAIAGAVFHAMCVRHTIRTGVIPKPSEWLQISEQVAIVPELVKRDRDLDSIWLPLWEQAAARRFDVAFRETIEELRHDIVLAKACVAKNDGKAARYHSLVEQLGCFNKDHLGSGTKTSVLAVYLASTFQESPQDGMIACANALGSDTDTIATMAGAIVGCVAESDPNQEVMDCQYISSEAVRLAAIADGQSAQSFRYPDLLYWSPPKRQVDVAGVQNGRWFVAGLGESTPVGASVIDKKNKCVWQWFQLEFGQHVLLKHRSKPTMLPNESLPLFEHQEGDNGRTVSGHAKKSGGDAHGIRSSRDYVSAASVNKAADDVIRSGFDAKIIGAWLVRFADELDGVDKAVAFSAIVAKARNARMHRSGAK